MDATGSNKNTIKTGVRVEPSREVEGSLNEQKLTVGVENADGQVGECSGELEEEEDDEPFVVEVVAVAELAVEMRYRWAGGDG